MQDALRALIENYCATLARQMNEIAGHLDDMNGTGDTLASLSAALDPLHQITGLSGTMGYKPISDTAMELETFMRRFEESEEAPTASDLAAISSMFEGLSQQAMAVEPENSTLYNADLSALAAGVR